MPSVVVLLAWKRVYIKVLIYQIWLIRNKGQPIQGQLNWFSKNGKDDKCKSKHRGEHLGLLIRTKWPLIVSRMRYSESLASSKYSFRGSTPVRFGIILPGRARAGTQLRTSAPGVSQVNFFYSEALDMEATDD